MSRTLFSRSSSSGDKSPLLPQHRDSVSLQTLSPRDDTSRSRSPAVSPSPPPSFYRAKFNATHHTANAPSYAGHPASPSRTRGKSRERGVEGARVQFAGPPPPIARSVLLPPQLGNANKLSSSKPGGPEPSLPIHRPSASLDPLLLIERRERAIQQELQILLDAQSAGLTRGFGGAVTGHDGVSDTGSSTPTTASVASRNKERESGGGFVPMRQPKKKVLSLRGARKALLRDIGTLAGVKEEESQVLEREIERRKRVLKQVRKWEDRMEAMRGELNSYSSTNGNGVGGEEVEDVSALQAQEQTLDRQIYELEERLALMWTRKKLLGEKIKEGINRREARLSSYRGALREVETEVKEFLRRPPVERSIVMGKEEGFTSLPPPRRTLGMARDWWGKELAALSTRRDAAGAEKEALEAGAETWSTTIEIVTAFEESLRERMSTQTLDDAGLRDQVDKMREVVRTLEENLEAVESKGWNLLVCAIGAELEAFREGEGILREALDGPPVQGEEEAEKEETFYSIGDGLENLEVRTEGFNGSKRESVKRESVKREESREESEDEGPNLAELMVDRGREGVD